ncbi:MAG TPA: hypothetical protein VFW21_09320 [Mycobacterium sp.]|nr:hypothetical protein [Mycobacterium sp.]
MITIARRIAAGTALAIAPAFIALGVAATSHAETRTYTGPQQPHTSQSAPQQARSGQTGPQHARSQTGPLHPHIDQHVTHPNPPAQPKAPAHRHHHYGM